MASSFSNVISVWATSASFRSSTVSRSVTFPAGSLPGTGDVTLDLIDTDVPTGVAVPLEPPLVAFRPEYDIRLSSSIGVIAGRASRDGGCGRVGGELEATGCDVVLRCRVTGEGWNIDDMAGWDFDTDID